MTVQKVARELPKYGLECVRAHEVGWDKGDPKQVDEYSFLYRKENENHQIVTGDFGRDRIALAVTKVEYVSDKLLYIVLRYSLV